MQPPTQNTASCADAEINFDDVASQESTFKDGQPVAGKDSVLAEQSRTLQRFAKSRARATKALFVSRVDDSVSSSQTVQDPTTSIHFRASEGVSLGLPLVEKSCFSTQKTDRQSRRRSQIGVVPRRAEDTNFRSLSLGSLQSLNVQTHNETKGTDEIINFSVDAEHDVTPHRAKRARSRQTSFQRGNNELQSDGKSEQANPLKENLIELSSSSSPRQRPSHKSVIGVETSNPKQRSSSAPQISAANSYGFSYSDLTSSEDDNDDSSGKNHMEGSSTPRQGISNFTVKDDPWGVVATTNSVFDLMAKTIPKEKSDEGRIYIARVKDHPGLVKIGRTTKPIRTRLSQIQHCTKYKLEPVDDDQAHSPISHHGRVEKLIHQELRTYRRCFMCPCKKRGRQDEDTFRIRNCMTKHSEWFEISEEKACEVVTQWKTWMSSDPYCDGELKPRELLRIKTFRNNAALMQSMLGASLQSWHKQILMVGARLCSTKDPTGLTPLSLHDSDEKFWNWDFFFQLSGIYLDFLNCHDWIFGRRPAHISDCSRWDSLLRQEEEEKPKVHDPVDLNKPTLESTTMTLSPSAAVEIVAVDDIAPSWNNKTSKYRSCNPLVDLPTALANYQASHTELSLADRRRLSKDESTNDDDDSDTADQPLLFFNYFQILQEPIVEPMKDASSQTDTCDLATTPVIHTDDCIVLKTEKQEPVPNLSAVPGNAGHHLPSEAQRNACASTEAPPGSFTSDLPSNDRTPTSPQEVELSQTCHTMSELWDYAWLQDMDSGDSDLLVIRVTETGNILRPIIVFDSARWNIPTFRRILRDEEPRLPKDLIRSFTWDARGRHHFSKFSSASYLKSGVQFCAIVPLCPTAYKQQRKMIETKDRLFSPLNYLLGISELLSNASNEAQKWCLCRSECWESGGTMILCDNMECEIGWYHQRCAGASELSDSDSDCDFEWFCRKCAKIPRKKLRIAEDMDMPYDALADASSDRVQQAKALDRVWWRHSWPSGKKIVDIFKMISQDMLLDPSLGFPECQYACLREALCRHWVTRKDPDLPDMIPVRSKR